MYVCLHLQGVSHGWTPLMWACYQGNNDAVNLLLSHGASIADIDTKVRDCLAVSMALPAHAYSVSVPMQPHRALHESLPVHLSDGECVR